MPDIQNYAPNFSIAPGDFKRENDPYAQILPMLLAGQQQAQQQRQRAQLQQLLGQFMQPQGQMPQGPMQGPPNAPMQGPQMPGQAFPPPASGMGAPPPQMGQQGPDPMKMVLGMMQANPDLVQGAFPAFVRAAMQKQKDSGISPYQQQQLALRQRQLQDTEKYQSSREQLSQLEASLRAKGLVQQAQRIHAVIADMDAKHPFMYGTGLMQSPSEAAGMDSGEDTGDDGWGDVTVSP